jgi:hypothetical protein
MNPKPTVRKDMGIVHSTIRMLIPLNKQSEALEILQTVSAQIQFNPNCIRLAQRHHHHQRQAAAGARSGIRRRDQGRRPESKPWWAPRIVPPKQAPKSC